MEVIPETRRALIIRYLPFYFYMSNMRESKLSHASTAKSNKGNNKLPNSEQSYKGKVKTHNYINRQNQSTTGKL